MRNYANAQLSSRLARLAFEVRRAARNRRPDDIHDLRVSIRRFLACLSEFREYFPTRAAKKCRSRLKCAMDLAAEVRNRDIALDLVAQTGAGPRSALSVWLAQARAKAIESLVEELRRLHRRDFSRRWREALELDVGDSVKDADTATSEAARYAAGELPLLARKFFKRGRRAAAIDVPPAALHQFRLAAKRFRYVVELFRPVYGPGLSARLAALRSVQRHLGEVSDCATACELLRDASKPLARTAALASRRIEALNQQRMRAFRLHWKRTFDSPLKERNWVFYLTRFAGRTRARRRA